MRPRYLMLLSKLFDWVSICALCGWAKEGPHVWWFGHCVGVKSSSQRLMWLTKLQLFGPKIAAVKWSTKCQTPHFEQSHIIMSVRSFEVPFLKVLCLPFDPICHCRLYLTFVCLLSKVQYWQMIRWSLRLINMIVWIIS